MKNFFKRIVSMLLCTILVLGAAPLGGFIGFNVQNPFNMTASAEETEYVEDVYTYTVTDGEATITDCDERTSGAITIPSNIGGYPVTSIGAYAFSYCVSLTSVTIPDSVTSIDFCAFIRCDSLTNVTIPNSVTSIGNYAFEDCDSLTSVTIGSGVTSIGFSALDCDSLANITVDPLNQHYSSVDGVLFNKDKTILIQYPIGNTRTSYTIPDSVTSIGFSAFARCDSLTSVTIPDSVTSIGDNAFDSCSSLESVTIGNGVTNIDSYAFYSCNSLESVTIPDGVTSIGFSAFARCDSLTSVTIPDSVTSIGDNAFYICHSLENVIIGNSVTSIGSNAFCSCDSLTSVTIGNGVTSIGGYAFAYCDSLTDVYYNGTADEWEAITIGSDNDPLLSATIHYNSVSSNIFSYTIADGEVIITDCDESVSGAIKIPSTIEGYPVTSIGVSAFENCDSLTNVTIGSGVTSIGDGAFESCNSLTSVTIGSGVTSIGHSAFDECDSLTSITVDANNQCYSSADGVLFNKDKTELVRYPIGNARTSYTIPDSVTSIGEDAFRDCDSLTNVTIPNSVTSIGDRAFIACDNLPSVTIPDSVTSIGEDAFRDCDNLTNITVDNSNQYYSSADGVLFNKDKTVLIQYPIGNKRTSYIIPDSVTSIDDGAFCECSSLESVTIPDGVTCIDFFAFKNCSSLQSVIIPDSVTEIGFYAFAFCNNLQSVTIPEGVTNISLGLFYGCDRMTSVTVGGSTKFISKSAFYNCSSLSDVYYNGTVDEWEAIVIEDNNDPLLNATIHYNQNVTDNIYNLGEETYSFENYGDNDSPGGHCFGMSATSSAYYTGALDISIIGASNSQELYSLGLTSAVKAPICYYQNIQGSFSLNATVAGGSHYKTGKYDITSDWTAVVNYVKNHDYDDKGSLQIGFRKKSEGGHAINFLRYSVVNGQERIYAYDNNFPNVETYFYKGSDGKVYQAPYSTFSGAIDCICLRNVATYMSNAGGYNAKLVIYADIDTILVEGAEAYPMDGDIEMGERVMYEIPAGVDEVTIVPLVDNAEFEYLGEEYAFGEINDETSGILKLATDDEGSASQEPSFTIINAPDEEPSIFAKIFGTIGKILLAPVNLIVSLFKAIIGLFK